MIEKDFPYIKYDLPNGVTVLLTPRPDAYDPNKVSDFVWTWNPKVRFQFTDDLVKWEHDTVVVPFHWYPWMPGRRIPTELVWGAVSLIRQHASGHGVIWMHCDSSSMRAPTFFGHFLNSKYNKDMVEMIVSQGKWTDGRHHSSPIEYAETSMKLDPGVRELITVWKDKGEAFAHAEVMKVDK
jgi:hypothetical protein